MKISAIIVVVVLLVFGGIVFFNKSTDTSNVSHVDREQDAASREVEEASRNTEESASSAGVGSYEAYSPEKLARAAEGDVVLFFKADWCPTCRALDADITENIGHIPSGVSILTVDYDTETELRQRYGVTVQHTLVQVSDDGSMIKKWSGSPTLARLVDEIE